MFVHAGLRQCHPAHAGIYAQITELEEYYLTRSEEEIFQKHATKIVRRHFQPASKEGPVNVIELGAGDGRKSKIILRALLNQGLDFEYVPIDISRQAMAELFETMGSFFKNEALKIHGVVGDYMESVHHIVSAKPARRNVVMFIGSTIGNFHRDDAIAFLRQLRSNLRPDDSLLLGCDLRKDLETMRVAYSDSKGVTRDFNMNLLTRMNRELGADFDPSNFEHLAVYNPRIGAMESYLLAKRAHRVRINADINATADTSEEGRADFVKFSHEFEFEAFEPMYLECSHKYTPDLAAGMLRAAGFDVEAEYFDERNWFVDSVATVPDYQC